MTCNSYISKRKSCIVLNMQLNWSHYICAMKFTVKGRKKKKKTISATTSAGAKTGSISRNLTSSSPGSSSPMKDPENTILPVWIGKNSAKCRSVIWNMQLNALFYVMYFCCVHKTILMQNAWQNACWQTEKDTEKHKITQDA